MHLVGAAVGVGEEPEVSPDLVLASGLICSSTQEARTDLTGARIRWARDPGKAW